MPRKKRTIDSMSSAGGTMYDHTMMTERVQGLETRLKDIEQSEYFLTPQLLKKFESIEKRLTDLEQTDYFFSPKMVGTIKNIENRFHTLESVYNTLLDRANKLDNKNYNLGFHARAAQEYLGISENKWAEMKPETHDLLIKHCRTIGIIR